jgi:hypothetical protein
LYNQQGRSKRVDFQTIQDDEWIIEELAAGWVYIYIYIYRDKKVKQSVNEAADCLRVEPVEVNHQVKDTYI